MPPTAGCCTVNLTFFSTAWLKSTGKDGMLTEEAVGGVNPETHVCPKCGRPDVAVATDGRVEDGNAVVFGTKKA